MAYLNVRWPFLSINFLSVRTSSLLEFQGHCIDVMLAFTQNPHQSHLCKLSQRCKLIFKLSLHHHVLSISALGLIRGFPSPKPLVPNMTWRAAINHLRRSSQAEWTGRKSHRKKKTKQKCFPDNGAGKETSPSWMKQILICRLKL